MADYRIKLKESEKKVKFLDLAWESKTLWNMIVTVIPIVIGSVGSHQRTDIGTGGRVENIQTTALLRSARKLRKVLRLLWLKLQ